MEERTKKEKLFVKNLTFYAELFVNLGISLTKILHGVELGSLISKVILVFKKLRADV